MTQYIDPYGRICDAAEALSNGAIRHGYRLRKSVTARDGDYISFDINCFDAGPERSQVFLTDASRAPDPNALVRDALRASRYDPFGAAQAVARPKQPEATQHTQVANDRQTWGSTVRDTVRSARYV